MKSIILTICLFVSPKNNDVETYEIIGTRSHIIKYKNDTWFVPSGGEVVKFSNQKDFYDAFDGVKMIRHFPPKPYFPERSVDFFW